jgi:hypothetical protein
VNLVHWQAHGIAPPGWSHRDGIALSTCSPAHPARSGNRTGCPPLQSTPWFVILRMYRPEPAVIEAKWESPGITLVT